MANVLVVEDDPTLRMLLSMHLQSASHTVVTATDGLDGLSKVTSLIPDLIVSACPVDGSTLERVGH